MMNHLQKWYSTNVRLRLVKIVEQLVKTVGQRLKELVQGKRARERLVARVMEHGRIRKMRRYILVGIGIFYFRISFHQCIPQTQRKVG